jgi:hypothetical protein
VIVRVGAGTEGSLFIFPGEDEGGVDVIRALRSRLVDRVQRASKSNLVAEDPAPISWASPVCVVQLNLLAALARPDAKVRDQESEATRHTEARPDRDAATMRYFLH